MKIVATCRTLNEERNIDAFCRAYSEFCDFLLVADGGSTDDTVERALQYPKVQVRPFDIKVTLKDGTQRNPDGPHVQFLVDWATEIGGDWLIHQDCDQRPNKFLKNDARTILEYAREDYLLVTQIFMWGNNQYFRDLTYRGNVPMQGLWAWRLSTGLRILDAMPHYTFSLNGADMLDLEKANHRKILPPYCFMHFGWPDEETTRKHVEYYKRTGLIEGMQHPLNFGGRPSPKLEWMVE